MEAGIGQPVYLGIDIGGTASRWAAIDANGSMLRGKAGGASGRIFDEHERSRLEAVLSRIALELQVQNLTVKAAVIGLTGFGSPASLDVRRMSAAAFGAGEESIQAFDDMTLAYLDQFAPGEGHLVSAGTGSFGFHIGEDETKVRVGGRGTLIDDGGSGAWIALRALDELYRAYDEADSFKTVELLADEVFAIIGGRDWDTVRHFVYSGDRGRIGTLAIGVARAASGGDTTSLSILRRAAVELSRLAEALIKRVGPRPVAFVGGVFDLHPILRDETITSLSGHQVLFPKSDLAGTAAWLAFRDQL